MDRNITQLIHRLEVCCFPSVVYECAWKQSSAALIPFESIVNTTQASFACIESMKRKA
jgi:hypothetical protein